VGLATADLVGKHGMTCGSILRGPETEETTADKICRSEKVTFYFDCIVEKKCQAIPGYVKSRVLITVQSPAQPATGIRPEPRDLDPDVTVDRNGLTPRPSTGPQRLFPLCILVSRYAVHTAPPRLLQNPVQIHVFARASSAFGFPEMDRKVPHS
jgi:hypothetical protein